MVNGVVRHCTKAGHTRLETKKKKKKSHSVDLLVVGDAVLACGSGIPLTFQRAVPARTLGQLFQVRIVVTYFWSSLSVRFFSS